MMEVISLLERSEALEPNKQTLQMRYDVLTEYLWRFFSTEERETEHGKQIKAKIDVLKNNPLVTTDDPSRMLMFMLMEYNMVISIPLGRSIAAWDEGARLTSDGIHDFLVFYFSGPPRAWVELDTRQNTGTRGEFLHFYRLFSLVMYHFYNMLHCSAECAALISAQTDIHWGSDCGELMRVAESHTFHMCAPLASVTARAITRRGVRNLC